MRGGECAPKSTAADDLRGDRRIDVDVRGPERLGTGFRPYDRFTVNLHTARGWMRLERDLLRSGPVVGVLPIDIDRQEIVLIRQFRLGGHLGNDLGEMVEIVAGRVDAGESNGDAARRECREEIGVTPDMLIPLFAFAPAPALTDEFMQVFLARIDASAVPPRGGMPHEGEETTVHRYPLTGVAELVSGNFIHSGPTLIALQWTVMNMEAIGRYLRR